MEGSSKTIASLKAELEQERQSKQSVAAEFEQERLKVQALNVIDQAGALSPQQLYNLLQAEHGLRKARTVLWRLSSGRRRLSATTPWQSAYSS